MRSRTGRDPGGQLIPEAIRKGATVGSCRPGRSGTGTGAAGTPADGQKGQLQGLFLSMGRNTRGTAAGGTETHRGRENGTRCRQGRSWYQGTRAAPAAGFPSYRYQVGSCRRSGTGAAIREAAQLVPGKMQRGEILRL